MRPHVSAETLAQFRQGDLSPRHRTRIGAHLSRCAHCRNLNKDLAGISELLASAHPPPMPDHLTSRIEAALAREAAGRVTVPAGSKPTAGAAGGGAAGPSGPVGGPGRRHGRAPGGSRRGWRPLLPRTRPRLALSAMAAAAVLVVAGVGVYEMVQPGSSQPSGSSAASAAGSPASGVHSFAAPAQGTVLQYQRGGQIARITPISSRTDFTTSKLSAQVATQVSRYAAGTQAAPMAGSGTRSPAEGPAQSQRFGNLAVSALQGCVNRIAAGELVVLVEVARFQGALATIIVTEVSQAAPRQVWVVGPGCSASRSDLLYRSALSAAG
jgi:hypothetical protein